MSKRGEFDVVFAVDCETSGINFKSDDLSEGYQSISWGIVAADAKTFKTIDKMYVEIKYDKKYIWDYRAEQVHRLSRGYLREHGLDEEDAAVEIGEFLDKYNGGLSKAIVLLGHNVAVFDRVFLRKLLHDNGFPFKFAHRGLDSFSLSMATVEEYNSDDLFEAFGLPERKEHNALEDAEHALEVFRVVKTLWNDYIT